MTETSGGLTIVVFLTGTGVEIGLTMTLTVVLVEIVLTVV